MALITFDKQALVEISVALQMRAAFVETGNPKLRRNQAIDDRNYSVIRKTSPEEDRLIVTLHEIGQRLERTSPGRAVDIADDSLSLVRTALKMRINFIETGLPLSGQAAARFATQNGIRQRPVHALTRTQEDVVKILRSFISDIDGVASEAMSSSKHLRSEPSAWLASLPTSAEKIAEMSVQRALAFS